MEPLGIEGAWVFRPRIFQDVRGDFLEWFRAAEVTEDLGRTMSVAQANCSVSRRGVIRGIHFADVPPGQAKYVTCVGGAILDVAVDLRVGSRTFARWQGVQLDDEKRLALYLAEGLGHAFMALTEQATVMYLCSTPYDPAREHGVHPLDPRIGIDWAVGQEAILSPKDDAAPRLDEARRAGLLPDYSACRASSSRLTGRDQPIPRPEPDVSFRSSQMRPRRGKRSAQP
jgi:dTDP-4-dehydrorhamnose 3,5-epimerase